MNEISFYLKFDRCSGNFQLKKSMTFDMDIQEEYFFCHLWINLLKHCEKNPDEN